MEWFKPNILIGGFHFKDLDPSDKDDTRLFEAAQILKTYNTKYFTCHCTGVDQFNFLKSIMNQQLEYISTGQIIEI